MKMKKYCGSVVCSSMEVSEAIHTVGETVGVVEEEVNDRVSALKIVSLASMNTQKRSNIAQLTNANRDIVHVAGLKKVVGFKKITGDELHGESTAQAKRDENDQAVQIPNAASIPKIFRVDLSKEGRGSDYLDHSEAIVEHWKLHALILSKKSRAATKSSSYADLKVPY